MKDCCQQTETLTLARVLSALAEVRKRAAWSSTATEYVERCEAAVRELFKEESHEPRH